LGPVLEQVEAVPPTSVVRFEVRAARVARSPATGLLDFVLGM